MVVAAPARAAEVDRKDRLPPELEGVGVTPHFNARLPLDLAFVDSDGRDVTLGQFFDGKRPVILTMNYSNCPMLCSLQLNGLVEALNAMPWDLGRQFQIVTVSIDPQRIARAGGPTPGHRYLKSYVRGGGGAGWHFLTGHDEDIKQVAAAVGLPLSLCAPSRGSSSIRPSSCSARRTGACRATWTGSSSIRRRCGWRWSRPRRARSARPSTRSCFSASTMTPANGRYGPAAFHLMQIAGGLTVVVLGGVLAVFWRRESRKRKPLPPAGAS